MKLEDLEKKNIYQVPNKYFDQLPGSIMARVSVTEEKSSIFSFWQIPYFRNALTCFTLIIAFVFTFLLTPKPITKKDFELTSVSDKEVLDYLLQADEINHQDLTELAQTSIDITHEFIEASTEDLLQITDPMDVEEIIMN
ncbi:hypothetical protein [Adhaeribacter aquaticus]|uniref:hypothetical protein n=1 Tax=Adhaeribacter aquaticus TaxID=299567 RepID=UPI000422E9AB|nr:hypothetical protein [Adhaeribacter aquaticus]